MKPQEQILAFEAHAKALHPEFERAKSVLEPLFAHLEAHKGDKTVEKFKKDEVASILSDDKKDPKKIRNDKRETYTAAVAEIGRIWGTANNYKRPSPAQEQLTAFEASAKAHNKSFVKAKSVLKPLFDYLEAHKDDATVEKLKKDHALEMLGKGDDQKKTYYASIHELVRVWGTTESFKAPEPPPKVPPIAFVRRSAAPLVKWLAGYALAPNDPKNPGHAAAQKLLKRTSGWSGAEYKKVADDLEKHKGGNFAMYAFAAAHHLTAGQATGPRVEIVAWKDKTKKEYVHAFVLVGREGPDATEKVPDSWESQNDIAIVDGAMCQKFKEVAFKRPGEYPSGMRDNLDLIAVWAPEPDED
jgi:hypothetical protein